MIRHELIDFLRGELESGEADALRARLGSDPALRREKREIESLFRIMRAGEEIEPSARLREALAAAVAGVRPSPLRRLARLPGLIAFRFRISVAFRVAAISLAAHLIAMAVLFQVYIVRGSKRPGVMVSLEKTLPLPVQRPAAQFLLRLRQRRAPHSARLRRYGVAGQEAAIREGLGRVFARQRPNGSLAGDPRETAFAALALLAEGERSVSGTASGLALHRAMDYLMARARGGATDGPILTALVEDFTLSYDNLLAEDRTEYVQLIYRLIDRVSDDAESREALALARMAGFPVAEARQLGDYELLFAGDRSRLLDRPPTRIRATIVLARGQAAPDGARVKDWARPLFEKALADLKSGRTPGWALLTLQAPYRL